MVQEGLRERPADPLLFMGSKITWDSYLGLLLGIPNIEWLSTWDCYLGLLLGIATWDYYLGWLSTWDYYFG